jgi:hypothetical protein
MTLRQARMEVERSYLAEVLLQTDDLDEAAKVAGVHRKSLERLLRRHKLRSPTDT